MFRLLVLSFLLIPVVNTYAQVTVDFNSDIVAGCSPLPINFSDNSISSQKIIYRQWLFGNGNMSIGNDTAPQALYPNSGKYDVTLIVSVDGINYDTLVKKDFITVFNHPVSNLTTTTIRSGCEPLSVAFNDISSSTDAPLTTWQWDFGDGYIDSIKNPNHIYYDRGSFPVSLTVIDSNNCSDTKLISNYITVFKPLSSFTTLDNASCSFPFQVNFTNTSNGTGLLNYNWNFGDGSVSTAMSPQHVYNTTGMFNVTLHVTDQNNCSDTLVKSGFIKISSVDLSFNLSKDTVCIDENVSFNNNSTQGDSFLWDFGDGDTSKLQSTSHSYTKSGTFVVSLKGVVNGETCSNSFKDTVYVEIVVADFNTSPHFLCQVPGSVVYTDKSTANVVDWIWSFGNGHTAISKNPTEIYTLTDSLKQFDKDYYDNSLSVTTAHGCKASKFISSNVRIVIPDTALSPWVQGGCAPMLVSFKDLTTYATTEDFISSWLWDFKDGSTSTLQNPTHVFSDTGIFPVKMTIQTAAGCSYDRYSGISTGESVTTDFSIANPGQCASVPVQFIDRSTSKSVVNYWHWYFGSKCYPKWWADSSGYKNPTHLYCDTGWFDVTLYSANNGCGSVKTIKNAVHVKGPVALFTPTYKCSKPLDYTFVGHIVGATNFRWDFGDGQTNTTSVNPTHTYTKSGNYLVTLMAFNATTNCSYTFDSLIKVRNLKASFTVDTSFGCTGLRVQFNSGKTIDNDLFKAKYFEQDSLVNYVWNFNGYGNFIARDSVVNFTYFSAGIYKASLIVKDTNGCSDTAFKTIKIFKPTIAFTANPMIHCAPVDINFTDKTKSDTTLSRWIWTLGDGSKAYTQNPKHNYTIDSVYTISLQVFDTLGCTNTSTIRDFLTVRNPTPEFTVSTYGACINDTITFDNTTKGTVKNFIWNFGDGTTSIVTSPKHIYTKAGMYTIMLSTADSIGCDTTLVFPNYISIQTFPKANFIADTSNLVCYPVSVKFTDSSTTLNVNDWKWDFGDGATAFKSGPVNHYYALPGLFDVSLRISTSNGCADSITKTGYIKVKGPFAKTKLIANNICLFDTAIMYIDTAHDVHDFIWDYGDGNFGKSVGDTSKYPYTNPGTLFSSLLYWDEDSTCVKSYGNYVYIHKIKADFTTVDSVACISKPFAFTNKTTSIPNSILQNNWDFGDSTFSKIKSPSHIFDSAGVFNVVCIVENKYKCADTTSALVKVISVPGLTLADTTLICESDSVVFDAGSGFLNYLWSDSTKQQTLIIRDSAAVWGMVQNFQGCWSFKDSALIIQVPKPIVSLGKDTTICTYDSLLLDGKGIVFDSYLWQDSSVSSVFKTDTAGLYYVQVKNMCGITADTISVVIIPLPFVNLGKDTSICRGDTFSLHVNGSAFDKYHWSDTSKLPAFIVDTAGLVFVKVYNRCAADTDSLKISFIPVANAKLGKDTAFCPGDSIKLLAKGSPFDKYKWNTGAIDSLIYVDTAGIFIVRSYNVCTADTDSVAVTVIPLPHAELGNDSIICSGDTITFNVGGSVFDTYKWDNGNTKKIGDITTEGYHFVIVSNRCKADTDSVHVSFFPVSLNLGNDTSFCEGGFIVLKPDNSFDTYLWQNQINADTLLVNTTGTYVLKVTNKCTTQMDSVDVGVRLLPVINLGKDTAISWGTMLLDAGNLGSMYRWSTGELTQTKYISAGEKYIWVEVNKESCFAIDTIHIKDHPDLTGCLVDLPNAFSPNADGLNDLLFVRSYCVAEIDWLIFNKWGEQVFHTNDLHGTWDGKFKNKLQETEVYTYVLKGKFNDGTAFFKTGNVSLLN